MSRFRWRQALGLTVLLPVALLVALPSRGDDDGDGGGAMAFLHPERPLVQSLFDVQNGRLDDAFSNLTRLVRRQPDFRLAQLVYADVLAIQAGRTNGLALPAASGGAVELRQEAMARLRRYVAAPPSEAVPGFLLQVPQEVPSVLVIDLKDYRLYLFRIHEGQPVRAGDYYVSIGKGGSHKRREGDEKTPVGVYVVSSFLPGEKLPDMYGNGAFPISYPNRWDQLRGRTGSGIWIHGTESDRYSRPPLSSRGCVTLSNSDFSTLRGEVDVGRTPVVVSNGVPWTSPAAVSAARETILDAVEQWRRDWESRDTERYLSHYGEEFRTLGMNRASFAAYKRRVNAGKRYIRVELDRVGVFAYPGERNLVLVDFVQRYESDSFRAVRHKQQYWRRAEGGAWRIVFEEGT